jgi:hypothetical protein
MAYDYICRLFVLQNPILKHRDLALHSKEKQCLSSGHEDRPVLSWLMLKGIPRIYSRTDKRPTVYVGWPDFSVFYEGSG